MLNPINIGIRNGIIAGLLGVIFTVVLYVVNPSLLYGMVNFIPFLIVLVMMVLSPLAVRKSNQGGLSFGNAFMASFFTFATAILLTTLFTYILTAFIDPTLVELQKEKSIEWSVWILEKMNAPMESIEEAIARVEEEDMSPKLGTTILGYFLSLVVGLFFSSIIGLITKKKEKIGIY